MTDPTTEWRPLPDHEPQSLDDFIRLANACEERLRTTAEALRDMIDRAYLPESLTNARAILARLEQEGLT